MKTPRMLDIDTERDHASRCLRIVHTHTSGTVLCARPEDAADADHWVANNGDFTEAFWHNRHPTIAFSTLDTHRNAVLSELENSLASIRPMVDVYRTGVLQILNRCRRERDKRRQLEESHLQMYVDLSKTVLKHPKRISVRIYDLLATLLHPILHRSGFARHTYPILSSDLLEVRSLIAARVLRGIVRKAHIAEETHHALNRFYDELSRNENT